MPVSEQRLLDSREYQGIQQVLGPLIMVENIHNVGYNELVEIRCPDGSERLGMVIEANEGAAVVQVFEGTSGLSLPDTAVCFRGAPLRLSVSREMLGRVFDGLGRPIDGGPVPIAEDRWDVNGQPVNPTARQYPTRFIQTGISAIDGMNTLVRGQKLPVFSGSGLPHNKVTAQIVRQAKIVGEDVSFAIVFAAMGVKHDVARYFIRNFEETGVLENVVLFLSLADAPSVVRLITPRTALTMAEYLAFRENMHVLVILTDMTNYCEALREVSTVRGEIPSRKSYPGYLYSDLASLYERAGLVADSTGSITQVPILTMPNDDISHPVPDLTGYITEGQIVLERELFQRGIYPPIAGLPSLSRLMKDGIGPGMTRDDHAHIASQLFAAYARVKDVRALASVIGEEELTPLDHHYLKFGEAFERDFLSQRDDEDRSIEQTLDLGWKVVSILPREELHRVSEEEISKFYGK
ncbi:MAG TPA: V-type ATP synthase subunit B [bacterium]|nr:V-type ATP synthase subunit B [bacterium]